MSLPETIERVRGEIAAVGMGINEADAKGAWIRPILIELGWQGLQRIREEYSITRAQMRLDYALLGTNGKPVALIEAKAPREDLEAHVEQVLNYSFHEGVDIAILTTGAVWWMFLPCERGEPLDRRFAVLDVARDPVDALAETFDSCLRYENLAGRVAERWAKEQLEARRNEERLSAALPRIWHELAEAPDPTLVKRVQEESQRRLGLPASEELVKEVLRGSPTSEQPRPTSPAPCRTARSTKPAYPRRAPTPQSVAEPPSPPAVPPPAPPAQRLRRARRPKRQSGSPSAYRLWDRTYQFSTWAQLLVDVAEAVWQRHPSDFLARAVASGRMSGRTRRYLAESDEELGAGRPVGQSGCFIETKVNRQGCERRARALLEIFGHDRKDLRITDD